MASNKSSKKPSQLVTSNITQILGNSAVLPGESEEVYQKGLLATIQELGALTPLQIYLAEKIYECLWWMRRYENQKRATVIRKMALILAPAQGGIENADLESAVTEQLHSNLIDDDMLELLARRNLDMASLTQKAMAQSRADLANLDEMIVIKAKTLAGFQASYEVLVNRKINSQRMLLQNELMSRDLAAIDVESTNASSSKPSKATGK
jgi:hypothetical protein